MMSLTNMVRGSENDAVAEQFIQLWEHDPKTLKFWRASSNFVYMFEKDGARRFLRFVHEKDNTVGNIQSELDFMRYLLSHDYPTVAPVLSENRTWIETVRMADDGCYYGVVFEQAKGIHVPLDQMTDQHAEAWGKSLAFLHRLSDSYSPATAARGTWRDALAFISSVLCRHPTEGSARRELERLKAELATLPADPWHFGLIHYDFEIDNIFYAAEESCCYAIDFDDAMYHWYAMDIATALSDLTAQADDEAQRKIVQFLTGYRSVKPLDERCIQRLDLFQRFADLYRFARILRSIEDFNSRRSPEWAVALRERLLAMCDRIRERYEPKVSLKPIDHSNWFACSQLEVTDEQKEVFPVPAVYWLAESAYCGWTPLAVYTGEQIAGFAVCAIDPDDGSSWIMAYMIDRRFQHKGLGRAGMETLIRYMREAFDSDKIRLGHRPENEKASDLYASLRFEEVDRVEREVVRELKITK